MGESIRLGKRKYQYLVSRLETLKMQITSRIISHLSTPSGSHNYPNSAKPSNASVYIVVYRSDGPPKRTYLA